VARLPARIPVAARPAGREHAAETRHVAELGRVRARILFCVRAGHARRGVVLERGQIRAVQGEFDVADIRPADTNVADVVAHAQVDTAGVQRAQVDRRRGDDADLARLLRVYSVAADERAERAAVVVEA